jgi:putative transposase
MPGEVSVDGATINWWVVT